MKSIVITGGTQGIGFALADQFLTLGCKVVICGRTLDSIDQAVDKLAAKHGRQPIAGLPCDVRDPSQVQRLWDEAESRMRRVDIWVNNAGLSHLRGKTWEIAEVQLAEIVSTNILGVLYGSQVAVRGMLAQGHGAIYNMGGMGSNGQMHEGLLAYGMTKYGLSYFTKGLAKELRQSPLIVGSIRPGMAITDMITNQYVGRPEEWKRAKRIFNIIADRPETIAQSLAPRILRNKKSGVCISSISNWTLAWRLASASLFPRNLFPADNEEFAAGTKPTS